MSRILFVADDATALRNLALPLADPLSRKGWQIDALASGASRCGEGSGVFRRTFDAEWGPRGPGLLHMARSTAWMRALVRREGYDVVHTFSPGSGFLARLALRRRRRLASPRLVHSAIALRPSRADRLAARWTDEVIVADPQAASIGLRLGFIPGQHLHVVNGLDRPADRDRAVARVEGIYARLLRAGRGSSLAGTVPGRPTPPRQGGRADRPAKLVEC